MQVKRCSRCREIKPVSEFYKHKINKDGYVHNCKNCHKLEVREWQKNNSERVIEVARKYRENNLERIRESSRKSSKKCRRNNPEKARERTRKSMEKWRENNPEWAREKGRKANRRQRIKNKDNPKFKLNNNIRSTIWDSLKRNKNGRHWEDLVGYKLEKLMDHLEKQFKNDMNWDNYGYYGWHVDHIRPISSFNFNSYDDPEFKECWALDNLQPLWAEDNLVKHNKYEFLILQA